MKNKEMFYNANVSHFFGIKKQISDKYHMKLIKKFNELSESASDRVIFRTKLGGYANQGHPTLVDLYKEPEEIKFATVVGGTAEWTLDIQYRNWGIELGSEQARLVSMYLILEMEDTSSEDGELIEKIIELSEDQFNWDTFTTEIHKFPLDLEAIEITMNNSMDPKDWKITLHIGRVD
jgi:hypothetical protein